MDHKKVYLEASKHKVIVRSINAAALRLREATEPMLIVLSRHAVGREHARELRRLSAQAFRKGCILSCHEADL